MAVWAAFMQLAEALAGSGRRSGGPHEFPENPSPQAAPHAAVADADVVLGLGSDFWGMVSAYIDNGQSTASA